MARKPGFHMSLAVIMVLLFLAACSGGSDPVAGSLTGGDEGLTRPHSAADANSRALWGYWSVTIDTESESVEIVPLRGVAMHVNAVEWMQPPGGKLENLQIKIVYDDWLASGRFDLEVTLNHPFPGLDTYTGFDVMGVFMTDGHRYVLSQAGVTWTDGGTLDAHMLNPDGYTRWWNQDDFAGAVPRIFAYIPGKLAINPSNLDAKVNPYKYFTDGLEADADECEYLAANPDMRGLFGAGSGNTRLYQLQWPMVGGIPKLAFDYAVVAGWDVPVVEPPVVPDDFPTNANALEPVALSVTDNSDLYYDEDAGQAGGNLNLDVEAYGWQYLNGPGIPNTIDRVAVELVDSPMFPGGDYQTWNSGSWTVNDGATNSSIWHVEINGLEPSAAGDQPVMVIFETEYDYDNGFGSLYPVGAVLSSYFYTVVEVDPNAPGTDDPPYCNPPEPEFTDRNVVDLEQYTADVGEPEGEPFTIDWSIVPHGDPPEYNPGDPIDTDTIIVNWWNATTEGGTVEPPQTGDYDVCVKVYNEDGENECCITVTVDPAPTMEPVTGQNGVILSQQPNQGAETCDLTVYNPGAGTGTSVGEIMYQDTGLGEVRMYRYNDNYSSLLGISTLDSSWAPEQFDDPMAWTDYRRFEATPGGQILHLTSGNDTWPSFVDPDPPNGWNVNDPVHCWTMSGYNASGQINWFTLYGDAGTSGNPDPDNLAWKHYVDWSSGVAGSGPTHTDNTAAYGMFAISEEWLPNHPSEEHPGTVYVSWSTQPFLDPSTDLSAIGLPQMSTQYTPNPGEIDDTDPGLMALGLDDENYWQADFLGGPGEVIDDITVWYMLSSESTGAERKAHMILLPRDFEDPGWNIFYYANYIGDGSGWGVDFGGAAVPVDVEVLYAAADGSGLDHYNNWLAVLLQTSTGWRVDVFRWEPVFPTLILVDSYEDNSSYAGTPHAMDIDAKEHEMHVLHHGGGSYRATVLHFTP